MAQAEIREVLSVGRDQLFETITQYESYPQFLEGCTQAKVLERGGGKTRVEYHVDLMSQSLTYTLDHREDRDQGIVEWNLVESNFFKKNDGKWVLKSQKDGKSDVLYQLDVEFKVPIPGFILSRLVKGNLPGMIKSFEKQAKSFSG